MEKDEIKKEAAKNGIDLGMGIVGKAIDFATGNTGIATELLSNTTGIVEGVSLLKKKITQKKSEKKEKKEHNGE